MLAGTKALATADFNSCPVLLTTVLEVKDNTTKVWRRYVAGMYENHGQDQAIVDGRRITQTFEMPQGYTDGKGLEYTQTLTLIEGNDLPHPILAVNRSAPCD